MSRLVLVALLGCGRIGFDARLATGDGSVDMTTVPRRNVAFVTRATYTGNLGGSTGGDAKCAVAATAAGLTGTFVAFLSTSTGRDAGSQLTASRGWARVDDIDVIDKISAAFFQSTMYA